MESAGNEVVRWEVEVIALILADPNAEVFAPVLLQMLEKKSALRLPACQLAAWRVQPTPSVMHSEVYTYHMRGVPRDQAKWIRGTIARVKQGALYDILPSQDDAKVVKGMMA
eukprot:6451307-Prymnesium_polylepis.1